MKWRWAALAALLLAACEGDDGGSPSRSPATVPAWEIGPVIDGKNYSKGLPLRPTQYADGWGFPISATAEPHYVTTRIDSLVGKSQIRLRFKVEGDGTIHGAGCPVDSPSKVSLYVQRDDDEWQMNGWRWWHGPSSVKLAGAGTHEIVAPLDDTAWRSVEGMTAASSPVNWTATKRDTHRVGFTFGNCEGAGHGARATAPVRFVVTAFGIE